MRTCRSLLAGFVLVPCAILTQAQEPYPQVLSQGPLTLLIAYKCKPRDRVKLRERMVNSEIVNFKKWQSEGLVKDYHVLFSRYLDTDNYDMFLLLMFDTYSNVSRWKEIEKTSPGGLSQVTLTLVVSATTYPLDLIRSASLPQRRSSQKEAIFFVIPYDYSVPTDQYVRYLDGYVLPQMTGWMQEKVLSRYNIYLSRYAASRPWSSLFVLEYINDEAFGERESTMRKIRNELQGNPDWKAFSENKQSVRLEKEAVIADELTAR